MEVETGTGRFLRLAASLNMITRHTLVTGATEPPLPNLPVLLLPAPSACNGDGTSCGEKQDGEMFGCRPKSMIAVPAPAMVNLPIGATPSGSSLCPPCWRRQKSVDRENGASVTGSEKKAFQLEVRSANGPKRDPIEHGYDTVCDVNDLGIRRAGDAQH
jgi:hypothetical protein